MSSLECWQWLPLLLLSLLLLLVSYPGSRLDIMSSHLVAREEGSCGVWPQHHAVWSLLALQSSWPPPSVFADMHRGVLSDWPPIAYPASLFRPHCSLCGCLLIIPARLKDLCSERSSPSTLQNTLFIPFPTPVPSWHFYYLTSCFKCICLFAVHLPHLIVSS